MVCPITGTMNGNLWGINLLYPLGSHVVVAAGKARSPGVDGTTGNSALAERR